MNQNKYVLFPAVLYVGLLVGFLDGLAAVIQTLLYGGNPVKVFQYISSSILGPQAFEGGYPIALLGVLLHLVVAFIWTLIFFFIYPRIKMLSYNRVITGIMYGIVIWIGMNLIVVPSSRIPASTPALRGIIISASILIVAIGLPLSFIANNYYSKNNS